MGCANRLLAELRHLLDSACFSFLGMLPTFTGFSHGVNQSNEAKKASLFPALFPSWWCASCTYPAPLSSESSFTLLVGSDRA